MPPTRSQVKAPLTSTSSLVHLAYSTMQAVITLSNGVSLPSVGLGTFRSQGSNAEQAVCWALLEGYRHIDTASIYKNEAQVHAGILASGVPRRDVFVTSKVSPYQQGTEKALAACRQSLALLSGLPAPSLPPAAAAAATSSAPHGAAKSVGAAPGVADSNTSGAATKTTAATAAAEAAAAAETAEPYIDCMLIHWPGAAKKELASPENARLRLETWRVLEALHREGRFRSIGVSNFTEAHLQQLWDVAEIKPMVNQIEVHPRLQQRGVRSLCSRLGVAVVAYASLGSGALFTHPVVAAVAEECVKTPAQVLLRWGLEEGCAVIPKSIDRQRIAEAAPSQLLGWALPPACKARLDALDDGTKFCWDPSGVA